MKLKECSIEQLNILLEETKQTMKKLQENLEHCQDYIRAHQQQIQIAESMIEETKQEFEKASTQLEKIMVEKEARHNFSERLFPIENVYFMCFERKAVEDPQGQLFVKGLIPYFSKYNEAVIGYQEEKVDGEIKKIPIYEQREEFTKNPDNICYELEECTINNQIVSQSIIFPGISIKDIILDMKENGELLELSKDTSIGYEEMEQIAQYAYENWVVKNGWGTRNIDFFHSNEKQKQKKRTL